VHHVGQFSGAAAAELAGPAAVLQEAAEQVPHLASRFLVLDVRHVERRVEHFACGIHPVTVPTGAAAEVAHLDGGKAVAAPGGAGIDRRHRGAGSHRRRLHSITLAGQHQLRQVTQSGVDGDDCFTLFYILIRRIFK
jgi:hypothetical protein